MKKIFNFEQLHGLENKKGTAIIDYSLEEKTYGNFDVVRVNFFSNPKDNICFYQNTNARTKNSLKLCLDRIKRFEFDIEYQEYIRLNKQEFDFLAVFSNYNYTKDKDGINIFFNKELKALCTGFTNVPEVKEEQSVKELLGSVMVIDNTDNLKKMPIENLNLKTRSYNVLKCKGISNVYDLLQLDEETIKTLKGIGQVSINDIENNIKEFKKKYEVL